MKKISTLLMLFCAFVGTAWADTYNGVYTLQVDENQIRGYVVAGEGYADYPVLDGITYTGCEGNSVAAIENGKNWYIVTKNEGTSYYFYNVALQKFLVGTGSQINFGNTPYEWSISVNGSYLNIQDVANPGKYLSGGCGRAAADRPVAYDTNNNDGGAKHTLTVVENGTTTFAEAIADAENKIAKHLTPTPEGVTHTSLRLSEGLLATQEDGQYKWTSPKLAVPANVGKIRVTFLKNSNNEKPAGFPCITLAEFYLYDKDGNAVTLTEANFSSNATQGDEGKISALCNGAISKQDGEGDNDWYWHSQWSGTPNPYGYHYLELDVTNVNADLSEYQIGWVTRRAQASPADVVISTGATTAEAAKNANTQMLPQVSTEIAKLYTIKSVRTKKFLAYDETQVKPQQINAVNNNSYWYFTQGTDGKVVMHNVVSGKVLGTNFEMASAGEWYVSPAGYRPGVVFSKTADVTINNCIDDQSGSIGSWSHNAGDEEGTTWLAEEVEIAAVDVPVFSLNSMKIASIGEATTELVVDQWYILNNVGRGNYVSQEGNNWKMRGADQVAAGALAKEKAGYLFKITKNGEYYNIMSGNGKYFQLGYNSATTSATPVNYEIGKIGASTDNFYLLDKDHGYVADGQVTGSSFVGWSTSSPTNAGGNDSYKLLPVELFDLGEIGVLKAELEDALAAAQTQYTSLPKGEGVGKYTVPADIETQFAAIAEFCEGIDENTSIDAINAKKEALEALVASVQLNMPEAGKFYRMHNDNKYITSGVTDGGRIALSEDYNNATTVYYYDGTHLLAFNTGLYFGLNASDWTFEAVGSNDISAIEFVAAANGAVAKYNVKSADRWLHRTDAYVNRCTNNTCGNAHNWTIEEVTWLPIPVNVEAGYTTIYSPVELALSYNRFKAYTVSETSATSAMLVEQEVVPAGVGVVLELQEGAEVVNDCVFLQVKATETTNVTSALLGTYADEYIETDAYVLGYINVAEEGQPEKKEVGFYTAALNVNTDTSNDGTEEEPAVTYEAWLNNGFKAYLPKASGASLVLRFNFGGNTTAIESVVAPAFDANAPIYDLSGRRVMNAVKGGLYIQNGKKFIVR